MTLRPSAPDLAAASGPRSAGAGNRAAVAVSAVALALVLALLGGLLLLVALGRGSGEPGVAVGTSSSPTPETFFYADAPDAPPLDLVDPDGRPFSLAALRGQQVLVFFGYTHCPDVCPVTIGNVSEVLGTVGPGTQAVFASIDPERDTTSWLKEYARFMPAGFTALTGTPSQVRTAADAWGVRYARVETDSADAYSMSHTADVFLVDAEGRLRLEDQNLACPAPIRAPLFLDRWAAGDPSSRGPIDAVRRDPEPEGSSVSLRVSAQDEGDSAHALGLGEQDAEGVSPVRRGRAPDGVSLSING